MRPILPGARGPAVEDIQRRLLKIGFDLGPTGVDGVFLGMTRDAVMAFQHRLGLEEDGVVGQETWSALVDSTFTLGDRTLYLRLPHFHGHDVLVLQEALSALGFSCGAVDAIFGPSTEHAVRAFQRNCGQSSDGIAGPETTDTLQNLRHVWEGKAGAPAGTPVGPVRSLDALRTDVLVAESRGAVARDVAERFANLALASAPDALVSISESGNGPSGSGRTLVIMDGDAAVDAESEMPVAALGQDAREAFVRRLRTAVAAAGAGARVGIDLGDLGSDDETLQRAAVRLLDAVCEALA